MKKNILIGIVMVCLLAISVSALELNMSRVLFLDDFNRADNDTLGNPLYPATNSYYEIWWGEGNPTMRSEVYNNSLRFVTDYPSASAMGVRVNQTNVSENFTIEFDFVNYGGAEANSQLSMETYVDGGYGVGSPFMFSNDEVWGSTPTPDWSECEHIGYNLGQVYHIKMVVNYDDWTYDSFIDDTPVCVDKGLGIPFPYPNLNGLWWGIGTNSGDAMDTRFDNMLVYKGYETPYYECVPSWECSLFANCSANVSECLAVNDLNVCGVEFEGNLSDYDEPCEMPSAHYTPNFITGDITGLALDTLGGGLLVVIELIGLVIIVNIGIYLYNRIKGGMVK